MVALPLALTLEGALPVVFTAGFDEPVIVPDVGWPVFAPGAAV
jgi:hypothetical protein